MAIYISEIKKFLSNESELTYHHFQKWLENNKADISRLSLLSTSVQGLDNLKGEEKYIKYVDIADDIYQGFQAFYLDFLNQDLETVSIKKEFYSYNHLFLPFFDEKPKDYGDIDLIVNDEHKDKVLKIHTSIFKKLDISINYPAYIFILENLDEDGEQLIGNLKTYKKITHNLDHSTVLIFNPFLEKSDPYEEKQIEAKRLEYKNSYRVTNDYEKRKVFLFLNKIQYIFSEGHTQQNSFKKNNLIISRLDRIEEVLQTMHKEESTWNDISSRIRNLNTITEFFAQIAIYKNIFDSLHWIWLFFSPLVRNQNDIRAIKVIMRKIYGSDCCIEYLKNRTETQTLNERLLIEVRNKIPSLFYTDLQLLPALLLILCNIKLTHGLLGMNVEQ